MKGGDWVFFQNLVVIKMGGKDFLGWGRGVIEDIYLAFTRY